MKRLLIIGAGSEQVVAINMARSMGIEVIVTDMNPSAPGMVFAHHAELVSTHDVAGNLRVAQLFKVNGVITLSSETAVPVVAHIATVMGLPSFSQETAFWATNKNAMRERFALFNVPTPASSRVSSLSMAKAFIQSHALPMVIKPSNNSGQRGTHRIDSRDQLPAALADALEFSSDGEAILEIFHEGPEINVTAAVQQGEIHWLSFSDRITAASPHFGIALEHRLPSKIGPVALESIRTASELAIRAVGLQNGIAYPQVLWTDEGPKVLEIAVRIPGGYMADVALHSSGVDMVEFSIRQALGETDPWGSCKRHPSQQALSVRFMTNLDILNTQTPISRIDGLDRAACLPGVEWVRCNLSPSDQVPELTHSGGRFGAVLAFGQNAQEAGERSFAAMKQIHFEFETINS